MVIEVLYIAGCCNHPPALERVRQALRLADLNQPIAEVSVSEAEGFVYIRKEGAVGFDGFQSLEDLRNNWNRLLDVAGLEPEERREAVRMFNAKIEKVPGTQL